MSHRCCLQIPFGEIIGKSRNEDGGGEYHFNWRGRGDQRRATRGALSFRFSFVGVVQKCLVDRWEAVIICLAVVTSVGSCFYVL
jgi:hypothetical protein